MLNFCKSISEESVKKLPFQKPVFEGIENKWLAQQAEKYRTLKRKIPHWWERSEIVIPDGIAIEQCTSEWVARWKRNLIPSDTKNYIDTTAGLGVDAFFLGVGLDHKLLFETDSHRKEVLSENLKKLSFGSFDLHSTPFLDFLDETVFSISPNTFIYADPDRRPGDGERKWFWNESEPNPEYLYHRLKPTRCRFLLKLSPMDNPEDLVSNLPGEAAVYTVSLQNEVKEVLILWDFSNKNPEKKRVVVEISKSGQFRELELPQAKSMPISFGQPVAGQFLLDPWAALRKGHQGNQWMLKNGWIPVGEGIDLFLADSKPVDYPGRVFEIQSVVSDINAFGKATKKTPMQVVCRQFSSSPEAIKKKYSWREGEVDFLFCYQMGRSNPVYIHAKKCIQEQLEKNWRGLN